MSAHFYTSCNCDLLQFRVCFTFKILSKLCTVKVSSLICVHQWFSHGIAVLQRKYRVVYKPQAIICTTCAPPPRGACKLLALICMPGCPRLNRSTRFLESIRENKLHRTHLSGRGGPKTCPVGHNSDAGDAQPLPKFSAKVRVLIPIREHPRANF